MGTLVLKQSTAVTVKIGPFLDDTDGITAETGLTISQGDVRLSKNGGDMAQKNQADACVHDEIGYYNCSLNTTDTGTLGRLQLMVAEAGAVPVFHDYVVVTANVYDTLCSTDQLDVNLSAADGTLEGTVSYMEALRLMLAVLCGKMSGGGTGTLTFRDSADSTDRVIVTVSSSKNRTAVTLDAS